MKPKVRRSLAKPRLRVPATDPNADISHVQDKVSSIGSVGIAPGIPCTDGSVNLQPAQSSPLSSPAPPTPPLPFSVLYLFAGPERKTDIGTCLRTICFGKGIPVKVVELDVCRDLSHDLSDASLWSEVLSSLQNGEYDAIILSPPCASWSRA